MNPQLAINLGGEGEISGVINQQGPWVLNPGWTCSRDGRTFQELIADGHVSRICPNAPLPLPDDSCDLVCTNSVPIDMRSLLGPGVQSSEIRRIVNSGGQWVRDGVLEWTKP